MLFPTDMAKPVSIIPLNVQVLFCPVMLELLFFVQLKKQTRLNETIKAKENPFIMK